jgi:hypothetical protein
LVERRAVERLLGHRGERVISPPTSNAIGVRVNSEFRVQEMIVTERFPTIAPVAAMYAGVTLDATRKIFLDALLFVE